MRVTINRHLSHEIVHREPDRNEVWMRVEGYGKLYAKRLMYNNSRYTEIDQVDVRAKHSRQVSWPVF